MKVELELWHMILLLMAFFGAVAGGCKLLLAELLKHQDFRADVQDRSRAEFRRTFIERLDRVDAANKEEGSHWLRVERELHKLQLDLPREYVRRDDYVQAVASIMVKLDGMSMKFENILLRGAKNHE